ncbi:MAG: hypothetical protein KJ850_10525 [Gammaproteobacteria bacterium]|nr:hypothetical protein [Gammaproteobacteria bacterium]MBU1625465.1 hypothetical protein [Gammaproteobacteria bacterium]MBU1980725.1 hypothetical protein [Gammaproteobacteria bacterium]
MKTPRPLLPILLAFALLFTQLGGMTHGIAHVLAEQTQDQSLPHDSQCELCAGYAQIGSAISSSDVHFEFSPSFTATYGNTHNDPHPITLAAFAARAPPHSA